MNVSMNGRKVKITPDVRRYIEKNMKKIDHFVDHIVDFKLILKKERHIYFAEVNITVKRKIMHVFAKSENVYGVIDALFDKIDTKMRRYWDKLTNRRNLSLKESVAGNEGTSHEEEGAVMEGSLSR